MFEREAQHRLLTIARMSLAARVRRARGPAVDDRAPLDLPRGAFVSIHHGSALRGCLGRISADWPIGRVVAHLAEAVSDSDRRFHPVTAGELDALTIEISVLTPEREITGPHAIDVGRHGLIVERGGRRGLLLPQVAAEHGWDPVTFLECTCTKAGLVPGAWRSDTRLFVFEAQVFGESTRRRQEC